MIVVADTSPLNYLVLIGEQELLPTLFGRIVIPEAVFQELQATVTPQAVQKWLAQAPDWLEIRKTARTPDTRLSHLDEGEREAIQLAEELGADLLLVDEKAARREAAKPSRPWSAKTWYGLRSPFRVSGSISGVRLIRMVT